MRLVIQDDADAVATWVSEYIVDRINAFKPTPTKPFVIGVLSVTRLYSSKYMFYSSPTHLLPPSLLVTPGLPTGSSPIDTYKVVQSFSSACTVGSGFSSWGLLIPLLLICRSRPFPSRPPTPPPEQQQKLVQAFNDGRVSFKNVITFNMDE